MRVILLLVGFVHISLSGFGQEWNLDFEFWNDSIQTPELVDTIVKDRVGIYPLNWYSNPDFIPEGKGIGQTTDSKNNIYAVALSGFYQFEVMRITTGRSPTESGWPIDYFPKELNGSYKAILPCSTCDSLRAYVDLYLTKYNSNLHKRDTVGRGHIILKETENVYIDFNMPIAYNEINGEQPDTITIVIAKERFGFGNQSECWECSHVFFDDFTLPSITSPVNENILKNKEFECYPNPITDQLTIINNSPEPKYFQAFDILGSLIFECKVENNLEKTIQIDPLASSILFISDGKSVKKIQISN